MCLILIRDPNVVLDPTAVQNAVFNNPDGWGYCIPDRGKLEVRRFYKGEDTDPDEVLRFLQDNEDQKVYLHLRFATAGAKNKANIHPFPVLTQRKHGTQVFAMHNGTYSNYKCTKTERSDTAVFTQEVLGPIMARLAKNNSKKTLLNDPIVQQIVEKFNEGWSRLVLMDGYGNDMRLGDGEQKEGFWISNDYSFRENYRTKKGDNKTSDSNPNSSWTSEWEYEESSPGIWTKVERDRYGRPTVVQGYTPTKDDESVHAQEDKKPGNVLRPSPSGSKPILSTSAHTAKEYTPSGTLSTEPFQTFLEMYDLNEWDEMFCLSETDILHLIQDNPLMMARCIMDMLYLLYADKAVDDPEEL